MPPRHGKSYLSSSRFPGWYLGRWPDRRVMLGCYGSDLAEGFGRTVRDVLTARGPDLFGVAVRRDSRASDRWQIQDYGGEMYSVGLGGSAVGRGGDCLILDDYCKNAEEALSVTKRNAAWDWYVTSWITRKQPGASEIIVGTRWHDDDLIGRRLKLAKENGEQVRHIRFPALAEADDPLGRPEGAALWPEKYPREKLEAIRRIQQFWFPAIYQQRPVPLGGALFKADWFRQYEFVGGAGPGFGGLVVSETGVRYLRDRLIVFAVLDPSIGQKNSDAVAMVVFAVPDDFSRVFVLHAVSERIPLESIVPRLDRLASAWRCAFVMAEANGFQVTVARSARNRLACPVEEAEPGGRSKLVRGIPAVELCAAGDLLLPAASDWRESFVAELCTWTGKDGDKDDQVDCVSYAVEKLHRYRGECGGGDGPTAGPAKVMAGAY